MNKVTLDQGSFKALAASKRIHILKLLNEKPHTQAELAAKLKMKPASVNDHLKALIKANLVYKKDEGRKWKYYKLTEKAKCILEPDRRTIWITLAVLVFGFVGTALSYTKSLFGGMKTYVEPTLAPLQAEQMMKAAPEMSREAAIQAQNSLAFATDTAQTITGTAPEIVRETVSASNTTLHIFLIITALAILFLVFLLGKNLIKKRRLNNS